MERYRLDAEDEATLAGPNGLPLPGRAPDAPLVPWQEFREKMIGLTDVTRAHFEKLANEFEVGLEVALQNYQHTAQQQQQQPEEDEAAAAAARASGSGASTSKAAAAPAAAAAEGSNRRNGPRTRSSKRGRGGGEGSGDPAPQATAMEADAGFWQCAGAWVGGCMHAHCASGARGGLQRSALHEGTAGARSPRPAHTCPLPISACTFANQDLTARACEMCSRPRTAGS